jgi:hypothetical protein
MKRDGKRGARSFEGRSGIRKPLKYFIDLWIIEDVMIGGRLLKRGRSNSDLSGVQGNNNSQCEKEFSRFRMILKKNNLSSFESAGSLTSVATECFIHKSI